ncbi:ribonuclease domain-containing protein [Alkalibacter mobilis]|uniref:ribonuclease domain-containing protein n=1 Tax=Alkalibacter mobilis TaxID=2787712 RepID=UPI00189F5835|nr:ribonuclease domain-containing protein [Alkalibacter mobilis]MBF7097489.1 ribonuclease [Alkalibacter mobilis]
MMIKNISRLRIIAVLFVLFTVLTGCSLTTTDEITSGQTDNTQETVISVIEDESYSTKDEVAAYLHEFGHLPPNYITKSEAQKLGWDNSKGNLWEVTDKMSIGGDYFGNREGLLPKDKDRKYFECDIDYNGGYRGAKRIVYSNDGLIFYTEDHYESFERLY